MSLGIIIALIAVVIILQFVMLANQKKNAKLISDFISERQKPHHSDRERFQDRRDGNFNKNRRGNGPQNSVKNAPVQQSAQPASVDSVEKSLRDINLKLKNAERDQEAARKKISGDPSGRDSRGPRGNRGDRDRDHRGGRDGNRRDRNNRGNGNWRERNSERGENSTRSQEHPAAIDESTTAAVADVAVTTAPSALPELNPVDFDSEMEHGRKFAVKRRPLAEEAASGVGQSDSQESTGDRQDSAPASQEFSSDASASTDSEISFGRR